MYVRRAVIFILNYNIYNKMKAFYFSVLVIATHGLSSSSIAKIKEVEQPSTGTKIITMPISTA